jgi:hypothetical protein
MEIQTNVLLGATIVGIINMVQMQFPQVKGIFALVLALVLGYIASVINLFPGLTWQMGVITALASSGIYKIASKMGGN